MSDENDKKRPDAPEATDMSGGRRPSAEDPLIELARIVHNNKQMGAPVSSGRVGNTDYFADLDSFADEPQPRETDTGRQRREPSFGGVTHSWQDRPDPPSNHGSSHEPPETEVDQDLGRGEEAPARRSEAETSGFSSGATHLSQSVAIDLEQNLTAELEDELLGALRQSVDQPAGSDISDDTPDSDQNSDYYGGALRNPVSSFGHSYKVTGDSGYPAMRGGNDPTSETAEAHYPATKPFEVRAPESRPASSKPLEQPDTNAGFSAFTSLKSVDNNAAVPGFSKTASGGISNHAPGGFPSQVAAKRPAINEDDLFAALTNHSETVPQRSAHRATDDEPLPAAGIDTLLADLDFPDPAPRHKMVGGTTAEKPASNSDIKTDRPLGHFGPDTDIDDMAWPAAADVLRDEADDDLPPPPEGYDLDAVARAMQESDPTLKGSGVLPPHSRAEQAAVPQAQERSRRGLFVAGGVLSVAVLGAAGFFFLDSDGIAVPEGPPPVISGLQEPLKIFPEEQGQAAGGDQSAKLIYDRVDGNSENSPAQLTPSESPEPASLPPAPAGAQSGADLVPGATKRVRTVIVRPDGTIVSGDDGATPAAPEPAQAAPRTVTTEPVTAAGEPVPDAGSVTGGQPRTIETVPVVPGAPAIIGGTETVPADAGTSETAGPVPSVLPRKKPAAPVQVAQAPAAAVAPAPVSPSSGPLNLAQPAVAPAATPAAVTGSGSAGTIPAGTYIVQVTSQRSAAAATDAYSSLQRRFPQVLGNQNAVIVAADLGDRGTFYRARIPTGSRDEAIRLCEQLQGAGGDCFVRQEQ